MANTTPRRATKAPRMDVIGHTLRTLNARQWPTPEPIVSPWLRQGEAAMIWAATGVGKTMLTLTIALMIAGGGSITGWSSPKPRKVLIVDGEMRMSDLVERLNSLRHTVDGIDFEAAMDNIVIMARQDQKPEVQFYDLTQPETHRILSKYIRENGFEVVILDNITTLTDSLTEENEVGAIKPVISFLMTLKQADVASIVVHHASKGGNNYRGSTGLVAPLEVVIGLTRPEGAAQGSAAFKLEFGKFRHRAEGLGPQLFELNQTDAFPGWTIKEDQDSLIARLVAAIRTCEFTTRAAAGKSIGITDKTKVTRLLQQAVGKGLITLPQIEGCLKGMSSGKFSDDDLEL